MEFLKSAVASAISKEPSFAYKFGDRVTIEQSIWTLYNGTKRDDGSPCSIFAFDVLADPSRLPLARNAVRKMRTLRHPGIIRFLDTIETESYVYLATERVTPLEWSVRRKALSEESCKWGLYTIASTMAFINDEGFSVHGNLRLSSVFKSNSGEWRVGGLELLSCLRDDNAIIYNCGDLIGEVSRYAPKEVVKSGWGVLRDNPLSAIDSYGFGILIFEVFNGQFIDGDPAGLLKNIPPIMHQSYRRLLNVSPKARLSVSHFRDQGRRDGGFFETPLIRSSEGIDSLGLKSDREREQILNELDKVANDFPEEFFSVRVLPELLKSVEFGGGGAKVFASCMKIAQSLSGAEWDSKIVPVIIRLFANPDRAIRVFLLDNLPNMIDHLSFKIVNDKIFPQMTTGFTDTAPLVREQTVKAILTIIAKLADRTVNGELLKYLAKTSNDEQPGIRTNTTICMGKLARNLGSGTRQKVLIAAFSRSLRDPFVHARNAALMALSATADLFTGDDCALKLLPCLCPLLIDKEKIVRDQANKTFDVYVQRVRKYATGMPDSAMSASVAVATNGAAPVEAAQPEVNAGWTGWAISSFTTKIGTLGGDIQPKDVSLQQPPRNERSNSVPPTTDGPRHLRTPPSDIIDSGVNSIRSSINASQRMPGPRVTDPADEDENVDKAWDEVDGESFFDAPLDARSSPSSDPISVSFDDGGEPDFEGWLKAKQQAKLKPKPIISSKPSAQSAQKIVRQGVARMTTTGSVGSGVGTMKLANAAPKRATTTGKSISTQPKEADDDWGDAWG